MSHQSAAYLHSIDLLGKPGQTAVLTCPAQRGWTARSGVRLHVATVPAEHVTAVVGLRVTTPARTVVDLARTLEFRAGVVAADSALHRKLITKPETGAVLAACSRRRGARRAGEVIEFADGRAESPLESVARVAFTDCGLPRRSCRSGSAEPQSRSAGSTSTGGSTGQSPRSTAP